MKIIKGAVAISLMTFALGSRVSEVHVGKVLSADGAEPAAVREHEAVLRAVPEEMFSGHAESLAAENGGKVLITSVGQKTVKLADRKLLEGFFLADDGEAHLPEPNILSAASLQRVSTIFGEKQQETKRYLFLEKKTLEKNFYLSGALPRLAESDLSTKRMVVLPERALPYSTMVLSMASIPGYAKRAARPTTLDEVAEILWTFSIFRLDPWAPIPPDYEQVIGERSKTKIFCFKENLKDLILTDASVSAEIGSILREVDTLRTPRAPHSARPLRTVSRDTLEWFFSHPLFFSIRWYLYAALSPKVGSVRIYVKFVDTPRKKNALYLLITESEISSAEYTPLHRLLRTPPGPSPIKTLLFAVQEQLSVAPRIFSAILDLFPTKKEVVLLSIGNSQRVETNQDLVEALLQHEQARADRKYAPSITGLVLNYLFSLSDSAMEYLKNASLSKFGFYSYYPISYVPDLLESARRKRAEAFIDQLLLGRLRLSHSLEHLVAPDTLYFSSSALPHSLSLLRSAEVHIHRDDWALRRVSPVSSFIRPSAKAAVFTVARFSFVEHSPSSPAHTLWIMKSLLSLPGIEYVDVSKTSVTLEDIKTDLVPAIASGSKNTLKQLSLLYRLEDPSFYPAHTRGSAEGLASLTRHLYRSDMFSLLFGTFDALQRVRCFFDSFFSASFDLPVLIHDMYLYLRRKHSSPGEISRFLSFRSVSVAKEHGTTHYLVKPFSPSKKEVSSAYPLSFLPEDQDRMSLSEVLLLIKYSESSSDTVDSQLEGSEMEGLELEGSRAPSSDRIITRISSHHASSHSALSAHSTALSPANSESASHSVRFAHSFSAVSSRPQEK